MVRDDGVVVVVVVISVVVGVVAIAGVRHVRRLDQGFIALYLL